MLLSSFCVDEGTASDLTIRFFPPQDLFLVKDSAKLTA